MTGGPNNSKELKVKPNSTKYTDRLARAMRHRRHDLGISRAELAACAEVSPATIQRIKKGVRVHPANLIRVATAMAAFELYAPATKVTLEDESSPS